MKSVSLLVDGQPVQTLQSAPYEFTLDAGTYASGSHSIALSVTTASGSQRLAEVDVKFGAPAEGSGSKVLLLALAGLLAIVAVMAVFLMMRRRSHGGDAPRPAGPPPGPREPISLTIAKQRARLAAKGDAPVVAQAEPEPVLGFLKMTEGPLSGQTFAVGAKPLSIGSGHRCQIQLPMELDGYEVPSEYARVWIRGDQLMVHEIRRLTAMGAEGGRWEFLSANDTFAIGPCGFRFELEAKEVPSAAPVPNALRDSFTAGGQMQRPDDRQAAASTITVPPTPIVPVMDTSDGIPNVLRDHDAEDSPEAPAIEQAATG